MWNFNPHVFDTVSDATLDTKKVARGRALTKRGDMTEVSCIDATRDRIDRPHVVAVRFAQHLCILDTLSRCYCDRPMWRPKLYGRHVTAAFSGITRIRSSYFFC